MTDLIFCDAAYPVRMSEKGAVAEGRGWDQETIMGITPDGGKKEIDTE